MVGCPSVVHPVLQLGYPGDQPLIGKDGSTPIAGWLVMVNKGTSHLEMDDIYGMLSVSSWGYSYKSSS